MLCDRHPYCIALVATAGGKRIEQLTTHFRVDPAAWLYVAARHAARKAA